MPGADGLACLSRIRKQHPDVKVVVLSVSTDENVIQTVLKRGASAFIVKSINPIDLPSALRQAVDGTVYSAIGLPDPGDSAARAAGLTERETAILSALARGSRTRPSARNCGWRNRRSSSTSRTSTASSACRTGPRPPASRIKTGS
jgi:Response regulator containing a CheY-like receiver domain and an HTH DNA-binding domain